MSKRSDHSQQPGVAQEMAMTILDMAGSDMDRQNTLSCKAPGVKRDGKYTLSVATATAKKGYLVQYYEKVVYHLQLSDSLFFTDLDVAVETFCYSTTKIDFGALSIPILGGAKEAFTVGVASIASYQRDEVKRFEADCAKVKRLVTSGIYDGDRAMNKKRRKD